MDIAKLTVNLPTDLLDKIKKEAETKGITATELIRRGLETALFLEDEEKKGSKLLLERSNQQMVQLVRK